MKIHNSHESHEDISRTRVKSRTRMTHQKTNSECQMPRGRKNDARIAVTQRTGLWETVFELLEEFAKHSNKENPHTKDAIGTITKRTEMFDAKIRCSIAH